MVFIKFPALKSYNETKKNYHNSSSQNIVIKFSITMV